MGREEILSQVQDIIREEFENDDLVITEATTANDVQGWDSLAHLSLMHEIEGEFEIKSTMGEIQGFKNVGEMITSIEKYLSR